jgi:hypothetical protein
VLLRELGDRYYLGLAVSRESNLGMARMQMKRYEEPIREALGVVGSAASGSRGASRGGSRR